MTVAERMRRDGWAFIAGGIYEKYVAGCRCLVLDCRAALVQDDSDWWKTGAWGAWENVGDHGLRDLAQRAKSAARRLARRK